MDFNKYIISDKTPLKDALFSLNKLSDETLTLFVMDKSNKMVGTLTDGDIRRALIGGVSLDCEVNVAMHHNFIFIRDSDSEYLLKLHTYRENKIWLLPVLDNENRLITILDLGKYLSFLPIDAILMAGGKGERLRPLTEKTPKPLLPLGDKPIIDHNIDRLINYGVKHISITVNYLKEQIIEHFEPLRKDIKVECVVEPKFLGTIGSVRYVKTLYNDVILLMNSDIFTDIDYEDFYLHFINNKADLSVAAVPYSISIPFGIFELDGRNIKSIKEKPILNYYANAGIYLIKKEFLDLIPKDTFFNATDFIDLLISLNKNVIRYPIKGTWIDIGRIEEYEKAKDLVSYSK